jgi:hypothetical protein
MNALYLSKHNRVNRTRGDVSSASTASTRNGTIASILVTVNVKGLKLSNELFA